LLFCAASWTHADDGRCRGPALPALADRLCHSRMDEQDAVRRTLEEMEEDLPQEAETALLLAEGYLLLLDSPSARRTTPRSRCSGARRKSSRTRADFAGARPDRAGALAGQRYSRRVRRLAGGPSARLAPGGRTDRGRLQPGKVRAVLAEALPRHTEYERRQARPRWRPRTRFGNFWPGSTLAARVSSADRAPRTAAGRRSGPDLTHNGAVIAAIQRFVEHLSRIGTKVRTRSALTRETLSTSPTF